MYLIYHVHSLIINLMLLLMAENKRLFPRSEKQQMRCTCRKAASYSVLWICTRYVSMFASLPIEIKQNKWLMCAQTRGIRRFTSARRYTYCTCLYMCLETVWKCDRCDETEDVQYSPCAIGNRSCLQFLLNSDRNLPYSLGGYILYRMHHLHLMNSHRQ